MNKVLLFFISFLSATVAWSQCDPDATDPVFDPPLPQETISVCASDIPEPFALTATDACDGVLTITPVDDTTSTNGICLSGGTIIRVWTATDAVGNDVSFTQTITIEADTEAPTSMYELEDVTEFCGEDDFQAWVRTQQTNILTSAFDDCAIARITNNAPERLERCGTINVVFTLEDFCGNTTTFDANYTYEDNAAPSFDNLPEDITLGCSLSLPEVPDVTASDVCSGIQGEIIFQEDIRENDNGVNCNNFQVIRTWTVFDNCGNMAIDSQIIQLIDTLAPTFDLPADITLECNEDINDINITGNISNLTDDCDSNPTSAFRDTIVNIAGVSQLQRVWMAMDACGNTNSQIQLISINDTIAPTFTVPVDLTVDCGQIANLEVTGEPTAVMDNCDENPEVTYEDIFTTGSCESGGAIQRVWKVTDVAGNSTEQTQRISIDDDVAPTFTIPAQDEIIACVDTGSANAVFQTWIINMGNAVATDNCTNEAGLIWNAYNAGTTDNATLSEAGCIDPESNIYRQQIVDFVVQDECGNTSTTTASFTVEDNIAPTFAYCPTDTLIAANDGGCSANFQLIPPIVIETCGTTAGSYQYGITENIASDSPNNRDVPVNTVRLSFPVNPSGNFANDSVSLKITLVNVDGEQSPEYFNVMTEDGTTIGRTLNVASQCGTSETFFTNITSEQINRWAGSNSQVTFFLEPNVLEDQPGRFSINDICGGSEVQATLFFETLAPSQLTYEYQVNGGGRNVFQPQTPVFETLNGGNNTIIYYATDCSGNTSDCSYQVTVIDNEPPGIDCPSDTILTFMGNNCEATYQLPVPDLILDNCSTGSTNTITLPRDSASAFITFTFDPDLNDYLADNRTFIFTNVTANALNDVTLQISFKGDADNGNGFFTIIGDDGVPIATTALGQDGVTFGDCNTFSTTTISIPPATYNTWAADGTIQIRAVSNGAIPIPPGGPGDGINPCDPSVINGNGESDGVSMLFAALSYDNTQYEYYLEGATTAPPTMVQNDEPLPELNFAVGMTEVFYVVADGNDNRDTCSFTVTVSDDEAPIARCSGTTVSINPSGVEVDTLQAIDLDLGSTDNCGIDSMFLTPNIFDCSLAGQDMVNVTLTVIDKSGNRSTCEAPVRIITEEPSPSYFIPPCGGDSLFLFANPPASASSNAYTYAWTGPQGFVSNQQNPIVPNIDEDNAGSYQVTITGITNCTAVGIVEVAVNDIPIIPDLIVPNQICSTQDLVLMTSIAPQGLEAVYKWYSGMPGSGTLIGTTSTPSLSIGAPLTPGSFTYYIIIEVADCPSSPSSVQTIRVIEQPVAVVIDPNPDPICEGESIELGTFVSGANLTYQWTGPNGYTSTAQIPPVIENAKVINDGIYQLVITRGICASQPANVVVTVRPKPRKPNLSVTGGACEGESLTLRMNVNTATVYRWIAPNANTRTTATNVLELMNVTQDLAGLWTGFVTQGGCDSDLSDPIQVNINATPNLSISANPNPICTTDDLQLNASPNINGATYEWTGPNNYRAVGQNPIIRNFRANQSGTYICTITTAEGCINTKEIEVVGKEGVRITGVSNSASNECITSPTDVRLAVTVFPPDDGTYRYSWTGPNFASTDSMATIPNATEESSGAYSVVVTTSDNCISAQETTTVSLRNAPAPPNTPVLSQISQPPFCEEDLITLMTNAYAGSNVQYKWNTPMGEKVTSIPTFTINNATINDGGEYLVIVNVDGCDSQPSGVIQIDIVNPPDIMASSNSPICEGERLELEADFVEGATYMWEGPSGLTASSPNPVFPLAMPDIHSGTFRVKAIVDGCPSTLASIDVEVNAIPNVPMAINNGPICIDSDDAMLRLAVPAVSSTPGAVYTWFDQDFDTVGVTTNLVLTLDDFDEYGEDTYRFYAEAALNGCVSGNSPPTSAKFNTIPTNTAYAGENVTVCEAQTFEMNAAAPSIGFGMWEQIDGDTTGVTIANPDDPKTTIFGLEGSGSYIFQWKLSNGVCEDYSSDEITILLNPDDVADAGRSIDTCRINTLRLNATAPLVGRGRWTQSMGQSSVNVVINDPFDPNTLITGLSPGNQYFFTWEILGGACGESSDEVSVIVSSGFTYAGEDFNDCGDGCVNLDATEPSSGIGKWTSVSGKIEFNNVNDPSTLICGLEVGKNAIVWTTDNEACGALSKDTVIVNYQPFAFAIDDTASVAFAGITEIDVMANDNLITSAFTVALLDEPKNGTLEEVGDGVFRYQANSNFAGVDGFSYELCTAGCECSIANVIINVGAASACEVPSIITPNNDGINDELIIPCLNDDTKFPDNEIIVFNQWGDEVFRRKSYQNDWRGTYNSEDLPDGAYFYVINFGDGSQPLSGYVMIQR